MILIWKGMGGMVIIIGIVVCLLVNVVTSAAFDHDNYFQSFLWPKIAALWITGVSCWFLGRYVNGKPPRILIDKATGEEVIQKPYHHFMFVKLEYWGIIFFGIGLVLIIARLAG